LVGRASSLAREFPEGWGFLAEKPMKGMSVAAMKGVRRGRPRHTEPTPGTETRRVYDFLMENKGNFVYIPREMVSIKHANQIKRSLIDMYGLDVRTKRMFTQNGAFKKSLWCLAGEYVGRGYIDYVAEKFESCSP
jgi:hypothetical protein